MRVHGTPFLTQALRGRYRDVEVAAAGCGSARSTGATLVAHLHNAYLPLRDLLGRRTRELPCEHVEGRIVLPYAELARVARIPGLALAYRRRPADRVGGAAGARHQPAGPDQRRGGADAVRRRRRCGCGSAASRSPASALPSLVLSQLLPTLNVPIPLPPLPYGLRLDELRPTANGLVVDGSADAVVFRRPRSRARPIVTSVRRSRSATLPVWASARMCACR